MNIELTEQEIGLLRKYTTFAHIKNAYPNENICFNIREEDLKISVLLLKKLPKAIGVENFETFDDFYKRMKGVPQQ